MRPSAERTKARIIEAAYGLFYREGFARVSMDVIAAAAGVTKRTLYHHYESKDALLAVVLDEQHGQALALTQRWGKSAAESPSGFVAAVFEGLMDWSSKPRWLGSGYTRLSMELADLAGHPARLMARRHKHAVEEWLCEELTRLGTSEPGRAARQTAILIEGCMNLMLIHGDRGYAEAARDAAMLLTEFRTPECGRRVARPRGDTEPGGSSDR